MVFSHCGKKIGQILENYHDELAFEQCALEYNCKNLSALNNVAINLFENFSRYEHSFYYFQKCFEIDPNHEKIKENFEKRTKQYEQQNLSVRHLRLISLQKYTPIYSH